MSIDNKASPPHNRARAKLGSFLYLKAETMNVNLSYFKESWKELGKITWPTRKQAIHLTIAVAVFSLVFGAFMGLLDYGFAELAKRIFIKG